MQEQVQYLHEVFAVLSRTKNQPTFQIKPTIPATHCMCYMVMKDTGHHHQYSVYFSIVATWNETREHWFTFFCAQKREFSFFFVLFSALIKVRVKYYSDKLWCTKPVFNTDYINDIVFNKLFSLGAVLNMVLKVLRITDLNLQ